jgi:hypothetical protein
LDFNISFVCQSSHSTDADADESAVFSGYEIKPNSIALGIVDVQGSDSGDEYYTAARMMGKELRNQTHPGEACVGKSFIGYEVYGNQDDPVVAYMSDDRDGDLEPCIGSSVRSFTSYF